MAPPGRSVRIRAYRQGLGDCFLLTFSPGSKERHMLIDCGVFQGTKDQEKRMRAVARNIRDATKGKIDVLVVTHEHWDHLSGFEQAKSVFAGIRFDSLWLAWTEDPNDTVANQLKKEQTELCAKLVGALNAWAKQSGVPDNRYTQFKSILGFYGDVGFDDAAPGAKGKVGTAEILQALRHHSPPPKISYSLSLHF